MKLRPTTERVNPVLVACVSHFIAASAKMQRYKYVRTYAMMMIIKLNYLDKNYR